LLDFVFPFKTIQFKGEGIGRLNLLYSTSTEARGGLSLLPSSALQPGSSFTKPGQGGESIALLSKSNYFFPENQNTCEEKPKD
jgi:hypothetical protein